MTRFYPEAQIRSRILRGIFQPLRLIFLFILYIITIVIIIIIMIIKVASDGSGGDLIWSWPECDLEVLTYATHWLPFVMIIMIVILIAQQSNTK